MPRGPHASVAQGEIHLAQVRRWQPVAFRENRSHQRCDRRMIGRFGDRWIKACRHIRSPRQHHHVSLRMFVVRMTQAANNTPFVAASRQQRHVFANLQTGRLSRYGKKLTSDVGSRIGLEVKRFMLPESARQKNVDDRFRRSGLNRIRSYQRLTGQSGSSCSQP